MPAPTSKWVLRVVIVVRFVASNAVVIESSQFDFDASLSKLVGFAHVAVERASAMNSGKQYERVLADIRATDFFKVNSTIRYD